MIAVAAGPRRPALLPLEADEGLDAEVALLSDVALVAGEEGLVVGVGHEGGGLATVTWFQF